MDREGLLWGEDPRKLLIDLRRQLHTQFPTTHDWASVTAYASLSPGFERQLASAQIRRANASIDEALKVADEVTRRFSSRIGRKSTTSKSAADPDTENQQLLDSTRNRVVAAKKRLEKLLNRYPSERARIRGLASTEKREAHIHYSRRNISRLTVEQREQASQDALDALSRARDYYWDAFLADRANYWVTVQYLSLTLILEKSGRLPPAADTAKAAAAALWFMAEMQSISDLQSDDRLARVWALGNLVELYILAPLVDNVVVTYAGAALVEKASARAREIVAAAGPNSFGTWSTRRQVARYLEWYNDI
ncbi:MAG: hypothetical protein ACREXY_04610, partial [Gammaproteobacteria bacterium]